MGRPPYATFVKCRIMQEHHEEKLRELDISTREEQLEMKSLHLEERERHQKVQEANLMHKEMLEQQMHLNLTLNLRVTFA